MSQEVVGFKIEVPGVFRYKLARHILGKTITNRVELTTNGVENVPVSGGVSAASNHRNNKWDVPILGWSIRDRRTPFYPAKSDISHGLKGWMLKGSGALFFERYNPEEEKRVYELMGQHVANNHMILTMIEGTSKKKGRELGLAHSGPLRLAVRNQLDELLLIGLGGTETPKARLARLGEDPSEIDDQMPTRVHVEIDSLPLTELTEPFRQHQKPVHAKALRDFNNDVVVPSLQSVVDTAYERVA